MIRAMLVGAAALALACTAHAQQFVDYTITGSVGSISDPNGVFGTAAAGDNFTLTFYANFNEGFRGGGTGGFGGQNFLLGGYDPNLTGYQDYPILSSPIDATLTIDGHELYFPGLAASVAQNIYNFFPGPGEFSRNNIEAFDETSGTPGLTDSIIENLYSNDPTTFGDLETYQTVIVDGTNVTGSANFDYAYIDPNIGQTLNVSGELDPLLYVASMGAAPEPSTWALIIVGIAFAGGALRRRPRAAPAA